MASTCKISILGWVSVVLVSLSSVYCLAVPRTGSNSTLTELLEKPGKKALIVENTIRPLGIGVSAFKTNGTVNALFCEHAGPAPHTEDITVGAVSWGCYAVKPGVTTIPMAVYKMKRSNRTLWHALKEHCGCSFINYKIPFLRYHESTGSWIYSTHKVHVGTTCTNFNTPDCKKMSKSQNTGQE